MRPDYFTMCELVALIGVEYFYLMVSEVRSLLAYGAHRELGLSAAEIGRVLNVSGQTVMKGANRAEETWESLDWIMDGVEV